MGSFKQSPLLQLLYFISHPRAEASGMILEGRSPGIVLSFWLLNCANLISAFCTSWNYLVIELLAVMPVAYLWGVVTPPYIACCNSPFHIIRLEYCSLLRIVHSSCIWIILISSNFVLLCWFTSFKHWKNHNKLKGILSQKVMIINGQDYFLS